MAETSHQWQSFADETSANPTVAVQWWTHGDGEERKGSPVWGDVETIPESRTGTL